MHFEIGTIPGFFNHIGIFILSHLINFFAAQEPPPVQWWQAAGGILAIPTTLIGIAYSFVLIYKSRIEATKMQLEMRKIQLEIREKEDALGNATGGDERLESFAQETRIRSIILRFIALYLILNFWGIVARLFEGAVEGTLFGLFNIYPERLHWLEVWSIGDVQHIGVWIVLQIPQVLYWVLLIAVGWPLFRDTNELLGLNVRSFFSFKLPAK